MRTYTLNLSTNSKTNPPVQNNGLNTQASWNINWREIFGNKTGECRVRAVLQSIYIPPPPPPLPPTSIFFSGASSTSAYTTQIDIIWTGGISQDANPVTLTFTLNGTATTPSSVGSGTASFTGLTASTTYTIIITATTSGGSVSKTKIITTASPPPPTDNMLLWYRFKPTDYTSSTIANYAPYNAGAIVSYSGATSCTIDTTNVIKGTGSLLLSGDNFFNMGAISVSNNTGFSYCFWYKSASGYTPLAYNRLFNTSTYSYICASDGSSPSPYNLMVVLGSGNAFWTYIYVNIFDNNWHHIVITNQSTGGWAIYIDNVQYVNGSSAWHSQHTSTIDNTQVFGGFTTFPTIGALALGNYDDVRMYTRGLSTAEVNAIYTYNGL